MEDISLSQGPFLLVQRLSVFTLGRIECSEIDPCKICFIHGSEAQGFKLMTLILFLLILC